MGKNFLKLKNESAFEDFEHFSFVESKLSCNLNLLKRIQHVCMTTLTRSIAPKFDVKTSRCVVILLLLFVVTSTTKIQNKRSLDFKVS